LLADDNDENHISRVFDGLLNNNALAYLLTAQQTKNSKE